MGRSHLLAWADRQRSARQPRARFRAYEDGVAEVAAGHPAGDRRDEVGRGYSAGAASARRRTHHGFISSPLRIASHSNHSPKSVAITMAISEASSPKPLPVSSGGPLSRATSRPWTGVPETGMS